MHTTPDYAVTQRWAARFHAEGFDGVYYLSGHDPSASEVAIAIFGPEGSNAPALGTSAPIPPSLLTEVEAHFGISVRPTP